jgi:hypothetical protein
MVDIKREFKGSYSGVKIVKQMKNYQIVKSDILRKSYMTNRLTVRIKDGAIELSHIYSNPDDGAKYSGAWYNFDLQNDQYKLKNNTFIYTIPEYEYDDKIKRNVKVVIHFTDSGFEKFINLVKTNKLK